MPPNSLVRQFIPKNTGKHSPVCVHVMSSLDGIELIQLDEKAHLVNKTAFYPCKFDATSRQLQDSTVLEQAIQDFYTTHKISIATPAVLILPSLFTREIETIPDISHEELSMWLISESERFFMFKRYEPQVAWLSMNSQKILYSAYQREEIDKFSAVFSNLKIPLLSIELNYTSLLKGLMSSGITEEHAGKDKPWCMLLISDFTLFIAALHGNTFVKTFETPLSVRGNTEESIVSDIHNDYERFIEGISTEKLVIINNTQRIQSANVARMLQFLGETVVVDQNADTLSSRQAHQPLFPCSLEALGGSVYFKKLHTPLLNFLSDSKSKAYSQAELEKKVFAGLVALNAVSFVMGLLIWGGLSLLILFKDGALSTQAQIAPPPGLVNTITHLKEKQWTKAISDQNIKFNDLLIYAGAVLPRELWIKRLDISQNKDTNVSVVSIQGGAIIPEPVSVYLATLKKKTTLDTLELNKIQLLAEEDGRTYYEWELKTKDPADDSANLAAMSTPSENADVGGVSP